MIIRLHNLASRSPQTTDLEAVTKLRIASDIASLGSADTTKEDVEKAWNTPGFNLETDAWAIVTRKGELVGYADVRQSCAGEYLDSSISVHPDYRGRGIGTLLTWLIEERARQLACNGHSGRRVVLRNTVCNLNPAACQLLEREGYAPAHSFWRLSIVSDEQQEKLSADLNVDAPSLFSSANRLSRTGLYVARQYEVYEKVLCFSEEDCAEKSTLGMDREPLPV